MFRKPACLMFFVLVAVLVSNASAGPDPVGWWRFDEGSDSTAYDSSGNGNNGTISDGVSWVFGHIGPYALDFGGGRVTVPDAPELRPDRMTVCAWINLPGPQDDFARVLEKGDDNHETYNFQGGGYSMTFMVRDNGGGIHSVSLARDLWSDEWIHIAGVYNGNELIIYVNGEPNNSQVEGSFTPYQSVGEVMDIGARPPDHDRMFFGMIDDVRVYDAVLSPGEIKLIFWAGDDPNVAGDPSPADNAEGVPLDVALSWAPGENAASHDVYFGTDFGDVNDANTTITLDVYKGNQGPNTYEAGLLESLELGTTYYWRIDEVDGTTWRGQVWRFTVDEGKASAPSPADEQWCVATDANLSWTPGPLATSHDVYFGTDANAVNDANGTYHTNVDYNNIDVNSYAPGHLEEATVYYWRVDELSATTYVKGDVWSFSTTSRICLQVDLGLPQCYDGGGTVICDPPVPGTVKEGWWGFVAGRWYDMYMHDAVWERGEDGEGPPPDTNGIAGSGVHVALGCGGVGNGGFHVYGTCRDNLGGGGCPTGEPDGDPIANGWYHNVDWGGEATGDILMRINGLPPGEYVLVSYHNHWEPCTQGTRNCLNCNSQMPNMPLVTATSLPPGPLPGYGNWNFTPGTGTGVTPIQNAYDVDVTSVTSDDEVSTSMIRFRTDGSDVLVIYDGGDNTYPDPARPGREGSKAILNAFRLQLVREFITAYDPSPADGAEDVDQEVVLSWSPGKDANSHDVYLGTDFNNVNNSCRLDGDLDGDGQVDFADVFILTEQWLGDPAGSRPYADRSGDRHVDMVDFAIVANDWMKYADEVFRGNQDANSYGPCGLNPETTYYRRVDEVNDANTWRGEVWSFTTWAEFDPNLNLVSWWKFDESDGNTAYDSAGDHNGTVYGAEWTIGQINGALSFDGDGDYVCANGVCADIAQKDLTLSAWINSDSTGSQQFIAAFNTYSGGNRLLIGHRADSSKLEVYDGGWGNTNITIIDGDWHLVACVLADSTDELTLYVDGDAVYSDGSTTSIASNDLFSIGQEYDTGPSGSDYFNGEIDDVRIYDRALSAEEIWRLCHDGLN